MSGQYYYGINVTQINNMINIHTNKGDNHLPSNSTAKWDENHKVINNIKEKRTKIAC